METLDTAEQPKNLTVLIEELKAANEAGDGKGVEAALKAMIALTESPNADFDKLEEELVPNEQES